MKRFMALLATTLVMALSATTVLAAPSVELAGAAVPNKDTIKLDDMPESVSSYEVTSTEPANALTQSEAKDAVAVIENTVGTVVNPKVAVYADITVAAKDAAGNPVTVSEKNPVYVGIPVTLASGEKADVFNFYDKDGTGAKWHKLESEIKDGKVVAKFTHFSPVMVITYTVETTSTGGNSNWTPSYDTTDTTPAVSPKTGVLPVAAIAAGICLAGAAVCGKKVKFN